MKIDTPLGPMILGLFHGELVCEFGAATVDEEPPKILSEQLAMYFDGTFSDKFDAPLPSGPPFTRRCWEACRNIPYGSTISYATLAKNAGSPKAVRAAGQAMRRNPATIITPCHRVIATSGELRGYAGETDTGSTELKRKRFLLELENCIMTP